MSRAFAPPDTLTENDTRTIADVRRAVWTNGLFGMGAGAALGTASHLVLRSLQRKYVGDEAAAGGSSSEAAQASRTAARKATQIDATSGLMYRCLRHLPPLGKNTFLLALLGGGALGSFVMSTTAGKNAVHLLHPIFDIGRNEHAGKSPYQIATDKAQEQGGEGDHATTTNFENTGEDELDAAHHRTRSLRRKASMKHRLESGQSLSDTHGNTWPHNDGMDETEETQRDKAVHRAEAWGRRQTRRREVIQERIERGNALSDSTGGHWSIENNERK